VTTARLALHLLALLAWLAACAPAAHAQFRTVGNVTAVRAVAGGVELALGADGIAFVGFHDAGTARVRWSPSGTFTSRRTGTVVGAAQPPADVAVHEAADLVYVVGGGLAIVVQKAPFRLFVMRADGSLVGASLPEGFGWDPASGLVLAQHYALPGEAYFGMGQRGGPVNRRGRAFYLFNVDWAGYGEFSDPLYSGTPFYYAVSGGRAHGLLLDNAAVPFFDFDTQARGVLMFGALRGELDYYVFAGDSPALVAQSFMQLVGRGPLPPRWSLGFHQSRYGYASQAEILYVAEALRAYRIPADVLYFDIDYQDRYRQFTWNPATFPAPVTMNAELAARGFRSVNIFDACLVADDPLRTELAAAGHLLKEPSGAPLTTSIWLGEVSWIDFTKPAAASAYRAKVADFFASGIDGAWIDLNEPAANFMPQALYDFGGDPRPDLEGRNLYALRHAEAFQQAQLALRPNERPWVMSRGGYTGIHRYAANWGGDALTSFDSLRVSIQMSASMGLSGQNQFGHDIGGFLGSPSAELFVRWMQFGSMIPLFRNHAMNTSAPREPWAFGEPTTTIVRGIVEQRYRLLPYLYSLYDEAERTGRPVLAPTVFDFPADPGTYAQSTEFMLGPALLVAPVFTEGAVERDVYLPAGADWIDYHSGTVHVGGVTVRVPAPLDRLPMFVRAGAIVPTGPVRQHVDEAVPAAIAIDLYRGLGPAFVLYDDDGRSLDYRDGAFARTRLALDRPAGNPVLVAERIGGTLPSPPRRWEVRLHRVPTVPLGVRHGSNELPQLASGAEPNPATGGWRHEPARGIVTAWLPGVQEPSRLEFVLQ
jgi:alpha-glucosidase